MKKRGGCIFSFDVMCSLCLSSCTNAILLSLDTYFLLVYLLAELGRKKDRTHDVIGYWEDMIKDKDYNKLLNQFKGEQWANDHTGDEKGTYISGKDHMPKDYRKFV